MDAICAKFVDASLGDTNLKILDPTQVSFDEITRQISAMPFLSEKRLVVIKNLLSAASKKIQDAMVDYLDKIPSTTIVIFYEESELEKTLLLFKKLNKSKRVQKFDLPIGFGLNQWIKNEVAKGGGEISTEAVETLAVTLGKNLGQKDPKTRRMKQVYNLWHIKNEIDKLLSYCPKITKENIQLLVTPIFAAKIFDLTDAIGSKNLKRASRLLSTILISGENELRVLAMITAQFRNLLICKDLEQRGENVRQKSGLHPFVAQKLAIQMKNFTLEQLKKIYKTIMNLDFSIKTGRIEPKIALDLLIAGAI